MNTRTEITAIAARHRANAEYGTSRANLMQAQADYSMAPDTETARALLAAHMQNDHCAKVWASPFPERFYN